MRISNSEKVFIPSGDILTIFGHLHAIFSVSNTSNLKSANDRRRKMELHCVANVYAVLPFYNVKYLLMYVPKSRNEERRESFPLAFQYLIFMV